MSSSNEDSIIAEEPDSLDVPNSVSLKRKNQAQSSKTVKKSRHEEVVVQKAPQNQHKNKLYKPPTVHEVNELKETQNMHSSNLVQLQIKELLREIKAVHDLPTLEGVCLGKPHLIEIKKNTAKQNMENELLNQMSFVRSDQNLEMDFVPPEKISIFGLNKINALPGPVLHINIEVKIPKACLNVKDYLNNRYFMKRHAYLIYIASHMKHKEICKSMHWSFHMGNALIPIIEVVPNTSNKIIIQLFAAPPDNYFKPTRFQPVINNIKSDLFGNGKIESDILKDFPTPYYNSALAYDATLSANNACIESMLCELSNVKEAMKLIYVWLTQRELNNYLGSFSDDLILYFFVYLVSTKKISNHMSSYEVARNFWNFMKYTDLSSTPISICKDVKPDTLKEYMQSFDIVFLDCTGHYNVTAFLNVDMYQKIRQESIIALKLLDDGGTNLFHSLFISKLLFPLQFDVVISLKRSTSFKNVIDSSTESERIKYAGHDNIFALQQISKTLKRGLNKRISLVVPFVQKTTKWSCDSKYCADQFDHVSFGINLDPEHAFSFLEKGPALNDPEEKEFREFWGHLSTDRRFKDGSVCVAVYFETKTIKDRREIPKKILHWILSKKLNLKYTIFYDTVEDLLVNRNIRASYPMGTNEDACLRVISASDEIGKKLRTLQMPLSITGIQSVSDMYSFTEVFPPVSTNYKGGKKVTSVLENNIILKEKSNFVPRYIQPVECILHLEHSSKWPRDLEGMRRMKTAFYLEISKLLSQQSILSSVRPENFDVLFDGFVFRYTLYLPREIGLLKKESSSDGVTLYKDSAESMEMEKRLEVVPKIVSALRGVQSQFPSYGPSTAIIKRWLRAHLLDDFHMPDIVINLLNASLFLNESPCAIPSVPQIAFLRFLHFMSELQHEIQSVVVNFNGEITKETIADIDAKLLQNPRFPGYPELCIVMPYDNCESIFTKISPTKEVLLRIKLLASETLRYVFDSINKQISLDFKKLFTPKLGFDVTINLRPLLNPRRHEDLSAAVSDGNEARITLPEFKESENTKMPIADFDPVQLYLKELRQNYGEFALFFHDTFGGNIIGVLWLPKAQEPKELKASYMNGRRAAENGTLVLNTEALIEDFYTFGKDLVKSIDRR